MHRFALAPVLALLSLSSLAAIGCAAKTGGEEPVEASENAVRTARCADGIAMNVSSLAMRTFFAELDAPSDYNAMKAVAADIASRETIEFSGSLVSKASGRCNYEGDGGKASLYTKGGKD